MPCRKGKAGNGSCRPGTGLVAGHNEALWQVAEICLSNCKMHIPVACKVGVYFGVSEPLTLAPTASMSQ